MRFRPINRVLGYLLQISESVELSEFKKILVTGGAGFVGSHLVENLVAGDFEVTVADNLSTGKIGNLADASKSGKVKFVKGDIRDKAFVNDALQGVDAVFHLAAIISVPYSLRYPEKTYAVNVEGTRNLLEASLRNSVARFVYVSSCAIYGEPKYLPIDEAHPKNPISPYAQSKLEAEKLCLDVQRTRGLETVILRPFNIYGPRQQDNQYGGVIAKFIK